MPKDKRFPEYDWIQDRIEELNEANRKLGEISIRDFNYDSREGILNKDLSVYKEMKKFLRENKINLALFKLYFSIGDVDYLCFTHSKERLPELAKFFIDSHKSNIDNEISYHFFIDFPSC